MNQTEKDEQARREQARQTPEGKLLVRYGFEPYDTESAARRVAEMAVASISQLENQLATVTAQAKKFAAQVEALTEQLNKANGLLDLDASEFIPGVTHKKDSKGVWQKVPADPCITIGTNYVTLCSNCMRRSTSYVPLKSCPICGAAMSEPPEL